MQTVETIPLKVAVRARTLIPKEINEGCQTCVNFIRGEPQLVLGNNRPFTFDYVYSPDDNQPEVYESAVQPLIKHIFKGYNATVLAYGQTGSGKTYTMGGCYEDSLKMDPLMMGVIPRILKDVFSTLQEYATVVDYTVKCSYMEVINEDLVDLFVFNSTKRECLTIREENNEIKLPGLKELSVSSAEGIMKLLEQGSQNRTTAQTAMNNTSSRSHAIFSVYIEQTNKEDENDVRKSKLQLVDLAGSERAKRTKAEGERFREGVNINKGLLALGNVISALGDEKEKRPHIPYRDSKLTRLLQDSLGGNSHTLMIACISPADSNLEETLNTLRYADRARKIKNKPIINIDPQKAENMRLKGLVEELQMQLFDAGVMNSSTSVTVQHQTKHDDMVKKCDLLEAENRNLTSELKKSLIQIMKTSEKVFQLEITKEKLSEKLKKMEENMGIDFDLLSNSINEGASPEVRDQLEKLKAFTATLQQVESSEEGTTDEKSSICEEDEDNEDEENVSPQSREESTQHVLRQAKMNQELQALTNLLEEKEQLALKACQNGKTLDHVTEQTEGKIQEYEHEIASLHKEKDTLAQALEDARNNTAASKVSEQRRKRLQDLETQIGDLRKKLVDHKKIMKHKEQSDKQVTKLNSDIMNLKQCRVKLMKQMKEDADHFRKLKQMKDREIIQFQQKDRKRQFEIQKLQRENLKTKSVLQRKSEEAAAANRRLKEALAKQKKVLEERNSKFEKCDSNSIGQRVRKWLSHEVEMRVIVSEAKYHRESLIQDRKELAEKLKSLKEKLDDNGPPSKKLAWMDDSGQKEEVSFNESKMKEEVKELQQQINIRNIQIADLQQKIFDADQETKPKSIMENLHTMMESKCAVRFLMDQAVSFKADHNRLRSDFTDLKENANTDNENTDHLMKEFEEEMKKVKASHESKILQLQKDNEMKVEEIMAFISSESGDKTPLQKLKAESEKFKAELDKIKEEKLILEKNMTKCMYQEKTVALMPDLDIEDTPLSTAARSPFLSPRPRFKARSTACLKEVMEEEDLEDEDEKEEEDEYEDPDWEKTPIIPKRRKTGLFRQSKKERMSDSSKCNCKTNCLSNRCACRKGKSFCTKDCRCTNCENEEPQLPESTTENDGGSSLNSTFEVRKASPELVENKRSVMALLQTTVRSSDEFEQPPRKTNSSGMKTNSAGTKTKKSKGNLKKYVSAGDVTKQSSESSFDLSRCSEDDSSLLEGGLKRKRKLLNVTDSFFAPL